MRRGWRPAVVPLGALAIVALLALPAGGVVTGRSAPSAAGVPAPVRTASMFPPVSAGRAGPRSAGGGAAGATWTNITTSLSIAPEARLLEAYAVDPALNGTVLFGGRTASGVPFNDTWLFSNGSWTNLSATIPGLGGPGPRWGAEMVWDPLLSELLLFGGRTLTGFANDTWVMNGTRWTELATPVTPSPRGFGQMFFDPTEAGAIYFGGSSLYAGYLWLGYNDTWLYSAGGWTNLTATLTVAPPTMDTAETAWDPAIGTAVVTGGQPYGGSCASYTATWEFNTSWTPLAASNTPGAINGAPIVYDPGTGDLVIYGGQGPIATGCPLLSGTWLFANGTWVNDTAGATGSSALPGLGLDAMGYDPLTGSVFVFGGQYTPYLAENVTLIGQPQPPYFVTLAANVTSAEAPASVNLTVGLPSTGGPFSFEWTFGDGTNSTAGPSAIHEFSRPGTYDVFVVVTNGTGAVATANLTLPIMDPYGWNSVAGPVAPAARLLFGMAYDPQWGGIVLFGGRATSYGAFNDTWLFANGTWTNLTGVSSTAPSPRWGTNLAWDPNGPYLVLFGGRTASSFAADTWVFNRSGWHLLTPSSAPTPRGFGTMFYDPANAKIVYYGGSLIGLYGFWYGLHDTWFFSGGTWTNVTTQVGSAPVSATEEGYAWDTAADELVMVGGQQEGGECADYTETYTFTTGWNYSSGSLFPHLVDTPMMAYDGIDQDVLEFGGQGTYYGAGCALYSDTWTWANDTWINETGAINATTYPTPAATCCGEAAWDSVGKYVLAFGGSPAPGASNTTYTYPVRPLAVGASARPSAGVGLFNVTFSATVTGGQGPYAYLWQFGDGRPNSTNAAPVHEYLSSGSYEATLRVTDGQGRVVNRSVGVDVVTPLAAVANASTQYGEAPQSVTFTAGLSGGAAPFHYAWTFGDGVTSALASPTHVFAAAGTYTVNLTVTDSIAEVATSSVSVTIVAALSLVVDTSPGPYGLAPFEENFTADVSGGTAPVTVNWTSTAGGSATGLSAHFSFPETGTYTVAATATDQLGRSTVMSVQVHVAAPLGIVLQASPPIGGAPLRVNFTATGSGGFPSYVITWSFGDGTPIESGAAVAHTYAGIGTYRVNVTLADSQGFTTTSQTTVDVVGPLAVALTAPAGPFDAPANLSFSSGASGGDAPYTYAWAFGDGGTSTAANPVHRYYVAGDFGVTLTVRDAAGDSLASSAHVVISPTLAVVLTASTSPGTVGTSDDLRAAATGGSGGDTFTWTGLPTNCASANASVLACTPTAEGIYAVTVTVADLAGTHAQSTITWTVQSNASVPSPQPGTAGLPEGTVLVIVLVVAVVAVAVGVLLALRARRPPPEGPGPTGAGPPVPAEAELPPGPST